MNTENRTMRELRWLEAISRPFSDWLQGLKPHGISQPSVVRAKALTPWNGVLKQALSVGVAAVMFAGGAFVLADTDSGAAAQAGTTQVAAKEIYACPMHPEQTSDRPGNCPICGMKLVKKEAPAKAKPAPAQPAAAPASAEGGAILVPPQRQQLIGVQSVEAQPRSVVKEIRTVGKVAIDETRVSHVHTKVAGYVEEVFADFVGKAVKRGEPLFTIYSPEMVSTQQEYLIALRGQKQLADSPYPEVARGAASLVEAARERLRLWDISEPEIEALEKEGKVKRALTIYSPASGVITERAAFQHGRYVSPETHLYVIVDLSRVWILGEIYETDFPYVRVGQTAEIELPYATGAPARGGLRGTITYLFPFLNPQTRTAQARVEFPNPDLALRPEMFVNLKLRVPLGQYLAVPRDAVLDTGIEKHVFVDKGDGYFEPRRVEVGPETDGYTAILSGLRRGERVVTAANFLLDSESRIKSAFANMGKPSVPAAAAPGAAAALQIEILEPRAPKVAGNAVRIAVRDAAGQPVEDAAVEINLLMPAMGTMPPMSARADLRHTGKGEYSGRVDLPMAGTWQTRVTVRRGGAVLGSLHTSLTAR
jgi:RND family efflux transporter MFP subunit